MVKTLLVFMAMFLFSGQSMAQSEDPGDILSSFVEGLNPISVESPPGEGSIDRIVRRLAAALLVVQNHCKGEVAMGQGNEWEPDYKIDKVRLVKAKIDKVLGLISNLEPRIKHSEAQPAEIELDALKSLQGVLENYINILSPFEVEDPVIKVCNKFLSVDVRGSQ